MVGIQKSQWQTRSLGIFNTYQKVRKSHLRTVQLTCTLFQDSKSLGLCAPYSFSSLIYLFNYIVT